MKKFINHAYNIVYGKLKGFFFTRDLTHKLLALVELSFNVCITGIIIDYIITHRNFLSYGLASALTMYYVVWLRKVFVIKKPSELDKIW